MSPATSSVFCTLLTLASGLRVFQESSPPTEKLKSLVHELEQMKENSTEAAFAENVQQWCALEICGIPDFALWLPVCVKFCPLGIYHPWEIRIPPPPLDPATLPLNTALIMWTDRTCIELNVPTQAAGGNYRKYMGFERQPTPMGTCDTCYTDLIPTYGTLGAGGQQTAAQLAAQPDSASIKFTLCQVNSQGIDATLPCLKEYANGDCTDPPLQQSVLAGAPVVEVLNACSATAVGGCGDPYADALGGSCQDTIYCGVETPCAPSGTISINLIGSADLFPTLSGTPVTCTR